MKLIQDRHRLIGALLLVDGVAVTASLVIASNAVTRIGGVWHDPLSSGWLASNSWVALFAIPLMLVVFALSQMYRRRYLFLGPQEYSKVFNGCICGIVVLASATIFLPGVSNISATFLIVSLALSVVFVGVGRFAFRRFIKILQRSGHFVSRAIIVGVNQQTRSLAQSLEHSHSGVTVVGFVDDDLPTGTRVRDQLTVLGSPRSVRHLVRQLNIDQIVIAHEAMAWESFRDILEEAALDHNGLEVKILPGFHEILTTGIDVQYTGFVPLLALDRVRITGFDAALKNIFDYGMSIVVVVALGPLITLVAAVLPFLGPGPIFHKRHTYGRKGAIFNRLSFNLRHRTASQPGWRGFAVRAIRRCRLEMMPQVFNVLQGQMSWIGPSPVQVGDEQRVERWLPNLLMVKSGITGPWAITASARGSLVNEMRGTMYYVRNYSIWLDIQILFHTVQNLVRFHPDQLRLRYLERISPRQLHAIQQLARQLTADGPASLCCVSIWDEDRHSLALAAVHRRDDEQPALPDNQFTRFNLSDAPIHSSVMNSGDTVVLDRLPPDEYMSWPEQPVLAHDDVGSGALFPLVIEGSAVGVVFVGRPSDGESSGFDHGWLERYQSLVSANVSTWRSDPVSSELTAFSSKSAIGT